MAEGFEASHVPQQSRRDKLRILYNHHHPNLLPLYDPSFLQVPPELLTCHGPLVKEEASFRPCTLPDPRSSSHENPRNFQDANPAFLCTQPPGPGTVQERGYSSFGGSNVQGLSLSLSSRVNHPCNDDDVRFGSLGPFTGSRFLKPAQKLLEELCDVGRGMFFAERVEYADSTLLEGVVIESGDGDGGVLGEKKSRLISLLDEVCGRYAQYYQQLQDVVASFECVSGLGNAAPYVNLAMKAMSKHFRCLKDAIMDQLQSTSKPLERERERERAADTMDDIAAGFGTIERSRLRQQRADKNFGYLDQQPVWRPQRGLPERAVTVLRAWLFEHFLHPYPTDTDKLLLAKQTGLSRCQVSNWFINARVRLWKPMVEEIHTLETQQTQVSQIARTSGTHVPSALPSESVRYLPRVAVGESIGRGTSSGGVTLTLGLDHHRLGMAGEGNGMGGGYGTQEWRQFGGTWTDSQ